MYPENLDPLCLHRNKMSMHANGAKRMKERGIL
jgi:hypothetical protein